MGEMYFILESSVNESVVDIPLGVLLEGVDGDTCSGDVESLGDALGAVCCSCCLTFPASAAHFEIQREMFS